MAKRRMEEYRKEWADAIARLDALRCHSSRTCSRRCMMARRKWKSSGVPCFGLLQVIDSCTAFGGVWRVAWVMPQQLHYLLERTRRGAFYYPEPCAVLKTNERGEL